MEVLEWPSITDAAKQLKVSRARADVLVAIGKLRVVHCKLGALVDPASLAEYEATRQTGRRARVA